MTSGSVGFQLPGKTQLYSTPFECPADVGGQLRHEIVVESYRADNFLDLFV